MVMSRIMPRFPIYIPSKGRADCCFTAKFLSSNSVPFFLVVESQEAHEYASTYGDACLLILPCNGKGSVVPACNWIKEHAAGNSMITSCILPIAGMGIAFDVRHALP